MMKWYVGYWKENFFHLVPGFTQALTVDGEYVNKLCTQLSKTSSYSFNFISESLYLQLKYSGRVRFAANVNI